MAVSQRSISAGRMQLDICLPIALGIISYFVTNMYPIGSISHWIPRKYNAFVISFVPLSVYFASRLYFGFVLVLLRSLKKKVPLLDLLQGIMMLAVLGSGVYAWYNLPFVSHSAQTILQESLGNIPELVLASSRPEIEEVIWSLARIFSLLAITSTAMFFVEFVVSFLWIFSKSVLKLLLRRASHAVPTGEKAKIL